MIRRFSVNFALFSMVIDVILVIFYLFLTTLLRPSMSSLSFAQYIPAPYKIPFILYIIFPLAWVGIFTLLAVYDGSKQLNLKNELTNLIIGSFLAALLMAGILYLSYRNVSRLLFVTFWLFTVSTMILWRLLARFLLFISSKKPSPKNRVLIIGASNSSKQLAEQIKKSSKVGLVLDSILEDPFSSILGKEESQAPITQICDYIERNQINEVVIAPPLHGCHDLNNFIGQLHRLPIRIWVIPDYYQLALHKAVVQDFAGIPMLDLRAPALSEYQRMIKRAFDIALILLFFPFSIFLLALIAIIIRIDSPGPVLLRQRRVGENGKIFSMYKFRTMVPTADESNLPVEFSNKNGQIIHKKRDDPRVTRVGKFIRRASLDELPQIFNVLKGEMSLVGPRPELPYFVDRYEAWQRQRFTVPQGITGWWQVNGRSEKLMHLHTEDDLYYVQNYSIWLDLKILFKTIFVVIKGTGAF